MNRRLKYDIATGSMTHRKLNCWTCSVPPDAANGDLLGEPTLSDLVLCEDGKEMGPAHADHSRIELFGRGLFSHWRDTLYFSTSDNSDPRTSGRRYTYEVSARPEGESRSQVDENLAQAGEQPLFPTLRELGDPLRRMAQSADFLFDPAGDDSNARMRMLESKVEYLLDELYTAKSQLRRLLPGSALQKELSDYQVATFNYQWKNLPYHDAFLTNPAWKKTAGADVAARLGVSPGWLSGKKVLDCGCGPGRYAWALSSLGATVHAFDTSENGLRDASAACADFPNTKIFKHSIFDPIPEANDFDLVWCYGVAHNTGDTVGALRNISQHAKTDGILYFMVYPEPERTNVGAYRYYHEIYVLRQLLKNLPFDKKAEVLKLVQGERWALSWFDAISSEVNDLYTFEELESIVRSFGYNDVRRTMPQEQSINVVATRGTGGPAK